MLRGLAIATLAAIAAAGGALATMHAVSGSTAAAQEAGEPPPRLVILARSDVPADALASGPVGGVLGAPVLLTPRASLHPAAADALEAIDPDVVVLAGGTTALSEQVEQAVEALGYTTRRAAGADRHETAVLVSALLAEFSTGRPVLTGTPVTDEVIPGLNAERLQGHTPDDLVAGLHDRLNALEADNTALTARVAGLESENVALTGRLTDLEANGAELQTLVAGVSRETVDGHDTVRFTGMNVQVVNGTGDTDGDPNGLGNLIIGYNAQRPGFVDPAERTGSHYLIVGDRHAWTRFGGLLAGFRNTASGDWASVTGGFNNTASGNQASVTGGQGNTASDLLTSVTGGQNNTANDTSASVTGGSSNTASGHSASVTGGSNNTASHGWASVTGGTENTADGPRSSVSGGQSNTAVGIEASVSGGHSNVASGNWASVTGGRDNAASGGWASVTGGRFNSSNGDYASVSGGRDNTASGDWAAVSGGVFNTASGSWASVSGGQLNVASGSRAAVTGGRTNTAAANWSIVLGGGGRTLSDTSANQCNSQVGSQVYTDTCPF